MKTCIDRKNKYLNDFGLFLKNHENYIAMAQ